MWLLIIATSIYYAFAYNLEFNSEQFPSWINEPTIYSSYKTDEHGIKHNYKDSFESSCVYFMPVHNQPTNKTDSYIFEPKCYTNNHCVHELDWDMNSKSFTVIDEQLYPKVNGTIKKVGIFSIAEFSYEAQEIGYTVYIIIEGCSARTSYGAIVSITWILTNDTKFKPTILKNYLLNLPVNDNKFYYGEMTINGDNECLHLLSEVNCEKTLELNIRRDEVTGIEEETPIADSKILDKIPPIIVGSQDVKTASFKNAKFGSNEFVANKSGFYMYVVIGVGVLIVVFLLSYLIYLTLY